MPRKTKLLILVVGMALGVAVLAQTGAIEGLLQKVQILLAEKPVGDSRFLNLATSGDKAGQEELGSAFSESDARPSLPSTALLANIAGQLSQKDLPIEQGFLLAPKEAGSVGNQFWEEPTE